MPEINKSSLFFACIHLHSDLWHAGEVARKVKVVEPAKALNDQSRQHGTARKLLQSMPMAHHRFSKGTPKYIYIYIWSFLAFQSSMLIHGHFHLNKIVGNKNPCASTLRQSLCKGPHCHGNIPFTKSWKEC